MEEYPRTLTEMEEQFRTEQSCRDYLFRLRWPNGFECPRCKGREAWTTNRDLFLCRRCRSQISLVAGTIFQDTRKPLALWFRAIWYVVSQKTGASALGVQRVLGLGSYRTAWTWLHKLRRAMVRPGRDRLSGRVEVDDAYVGGRAEGGFGRTKGQKALIVVAAEEEGKRIGRIRMRRVTEATAENLQGFVCAAVEPGSVVHTDGWQGYSGLDKKGYIHEVSPVSQQPKKESSLLPRVHRVISLLKRWLLGTHQGAVSGEHLDYYLDEFTFRFNRRTSRHRGKLFYRLLQQAMAVEPTTYSQMIRHIRGKHHRRHHIW